MRLPESKIKEAILHPSQLVRHEALLYFSKSYSRDPEVMPLAIKAIETYGRQGAFYFGHFLETLAQTEPTIDWAIRELDRIEPGSDPHYSHCRLIASADHQVLLSRKDDILGHPALLDDYRTTVQQRLELPSLGVDDLWSELESLCENEDVEREMARPIVEALARHKDQAERVLSMLAEEVEEGNGPKLWMELFLVMVAGEMRLEAAVPQIIVKFRNIEDLMTEECVTALTKIGTDSAVMAVSRGFLEESWDYRLYACGVLEGVHNDATVKRCLEFLPRERDTHIRTDLACALLGTFDFEGIEPVADLVRKRRYDARTAHLPGKLAATATIMGVDLPERDIWMRQAEEHHAATARRIKELEEWASAPVAQSRREEPKPEPIRRSEVTAGRNDPCPCGSGKKYKKCCMNKKSSFLL